MSITRNILLVVFAVLFSIAQVCACHSAQASIAPSHGSHNTIHAQHDINMHHGGINGQYSDDSSPTSEMCSHCDILASAYFTSKNPIDLNAYLDIEPKDSLITLIEYSSAPEIVVRDYRDKYWRQPLRQSPVSLKTRLLN